MHRISKVLKILLQMVVLYLLFLAGQWLQYILHLPVPGSIVGLLLLFFLLLFKLLPMRWVEDGISVYLRYLPLFFVPSIVGIMNHMEVFNGKGLVLILIVVLSTILTIGWSGFVSQKLARHKREEGKGEGI